MIEFDDEKDEIGADTTGSVGAESVGKEAIGAEAVVVPVQEGGGKPSVREPVMLRDVDLLEGAEILARYMEPYHQMSELAFLMVPTDMLEPAPFERDVSLSNAHKIRSSVMCSGIFVDPLVIIHSEDSNKYWVVNGYHRLLVGKDFGMERFPCLLLPRSGLSLYALYFNSEKAPTLADKSIQSMRMYRQLKEKLGGQLEFNFSSAFENCAYYVTFGFVYEQHKKFGGSTWENVLKSIDLFEKRDMNTMYDVRVHRAELVWALEGKVKELIDKMKDASGGRKIDNAIAKTLLVFHAKKFVAKAETFEDYCLMFLQALDRVDLTLVIPVVTK